MRSNADLTSWQTLPRSKHRASSPERPVLRRTQTNPELRPLSSEESEKVQSARALVDQLKPLTDRDLGKYMVDVTEQGVTRTRVRTRRRREKAINRTLRSLESLPVERTPSLELDLVQVVTTLSSITTNDEVKTRLENIAKATVVGPTLDQAIDIALANGEISDLIAFEASCWRVDHFDKLLFSDARLRPGAYRTARHLLRPWLDMPYPENCLRENGPVPLLLKCFLAHLAPWVPRLDPVEDQAAWVFPQLAEAIGALPPRLLRLLRFVQRAPGITAEVVLTFLCLRHFIPLADQAGLSRLSCKRLLHYCQEPTNELETCRDGLLKTLSG